jgi:hypothetical protein
MEKDESYQRGRAQVYDEICAGVDMTEILMRGEKYIQKNVIFSFIHGHRCFFKAINASTKQIKKEEFG